MKRKTLVSAILILAACSVPVDAPPPPTPLPSATPAAAFPSAPAVTESPTAVQTSPFCADARGPELISSLRAAIQTRDGILLASLVSPSLGMDVRLYRNGNVINYDVEHAKFLFETTYQADWGSHFASGEETFGAFHDVIVPSLLQLFAGETIVTCGELKTGGATYIPEWPYPGMDFYSIHFPGTEQYGGMDWQTWAVGMAPLADRLYITALSHFEWEP